MSDIVETVALAIHAKHNNPDDGQHWFHEDARKCQLSRQLARAAIAAMREPTDAMKMSGGLSFEESMFNEADHVFDGAGKAFRAMIDAALSPAPPEAKERS